MNQTIKTGREMFCFSFAASRRFVVDFL
jgi:hypothetical protein